MLMLAIENDVYTKEYAKKIFESYSGVDEEHNELLSVENFEKLAAKTGLFSLKSQKKFIGYNCSPDCRMEHNFLIENELGIITNIHGRLTMLNAYNMKWEEKLKEISKRIHSNNYTNKCISLFLLI